MALSHAHNLSNKMPDEINESEYSNETVEKQKQPVKFSQR